MKHTSPSISFVLILICCCASLTLQQFTGDICYVSKAGTDVLGCMCVMRDLALQFVLCKVLSVIIVQVAGEIALARH